ncbi:MAG: flagellar motor switch protein FliM [Athalassotoga sp.]|uniref:flagellar motor switch protein FliM n=1 Tax=Athalassotoga sp. TaxID=2022597 RepID=UPI003CFED0A1
MADILSQNEVDTLLKALAAGDLSAEEVKVEETKKVKPYDFTRPSKFSKEQIRTIEMVHENFARGVSNYFSARLRSFVDITKASTDQITYNEFIRSISSPSFLFVFTAEELNGNVVIEINLKVIFSIIDKLLGGGGGLYQKIRPLTEIENSLMRNEIIRILSILKDSWSSIYSFTPNLVSIENNPQFVQVVPANEMVVVVTLDMKIGEIEGFMNVCWPSSLLEMIAPKLYAESYFKQEKQIKPGQLREDIISLLNNAKLDLRVVIGKTIINLSELLNLEVGDVIMLQRHIDEPASLYVNGREKFLCSLGTHKGFNAVRITEVLNKEIDENGG